MKMMKKKGRLARGISLIEILVVIVILAILAGILFPILAGAKHSSKKGEAISNARQLFMAISLYDNDNDSRYPIESIQHPSGNVVVWTQTVGNYISKVKGTGTNGNVLDDDLPKVFFDPGVPYKSQRQTGDTQTPGVSGWGLSDDVSNQSSPTWNKLYKPFGPPYEEMAVASSANTVLLAETTDSNGKGYPGYAQAMSVILYKVYTGNWGNTNLNGPYGGSGPFDQHNLCFTADQPCAASLNITVFCDGHVKATRLSDLIRDGKLWSISGNGQWP